MRIRCYSELIRFPTFEDRLQYASIGGEVGARTFGGRRLLNQDFYRSREWKRARQAVLVRDLGCDLGVPERQIFGSVIVHHLNPILPEDLDGCFEALLDPEFMVCVSHETHNLLHYGAECSKQPVIVERFQNDTCPWRC